MHLVKFEFEKCSLMSYTLRYYTKHCFEKHFFEICEKTIDTENIFDMLF